MKTKNLNNNNTETLKEIEKYYQKFQNKYFLDNKNKNILSKKYEELKNNISKLDFEKNIANFSKSFLQKLEKNKISSVKIGEEQITLKDLNKNTEFKKLLPIFTLQML